MHQQSELVAEPVDRPQMLLPAIQPCDAEVDVEVLESVPQQFTITDEKTANWLVKKVVAAREYGLRVKTWAEQEQRRTQREEQSLMFLFGRQIETWVRDQIAAAGGRRKSLALPAGAVGFRTINSKLVVDDERIVIAWARTNCEKAIVVMEKLSKSSLDEHFEQTGELPEGGAHVEPAAERFYIK